MHVQNKCLEISQELTEIVERKRGLGLGREERETLISKINVWPYVNEGNPESEH